MYATYLKATFWGQTADLLGQSQALKKVSEMFLTGAVVSQRYACWHMTCTVAACKYLLAFNIGACIFAFE